MKYILLSLVAAAVAALAFTQLTTPKKTTAPSGSDSLIGQQIYADYCASCHGANLEGETPDWRSMKEDGTLPAPPHDDSGHTWHHGDRLLFNYVKHGGQAIAGPDFKSAMPGFKDQLNDDQIWVVLNFIKSKWSDHARQAQEMATQRESAAR